MHNGERLHPSDASARRRALRVGDRGLDLAMTAPARGETVQHIAVSGHVSPRCWTASAARGGASSDPARCRADPVLEPKLQRSGSTGAKPTRGAALPARVTVTPRA